VTNLFRVTFSFFAGAKFATLPAMPVPIINIAQMREWEAATWATGQTEAEVIRQVGKRIARRARKLTRAGDTILFLVGKGHNGDDTRAAAKALDGRNAELLEIFLPESDLLQLEMALAEKRGEIRHPNLLRSTSSNHRPWSARKGQLEEPAEFVVFAP